MAEVNIQSQLKVFLSYSAADRRFVRAFSRHLNHVGIENFFAEDSIRKGEEWSERALSELRSCECVLFFLSKSSAESPYVQQELGAAIINDKKIIPVIWGKANADDLPGWTSRYQCLDLRGLNEARRRAAIAQLAKEMIHEHSQLQIAALGDLEEDIRKAVKTYLVSLIPGVGPLVLQWQLHKKIESLISKKG